VTTASEMVELYVSAEIAVLKGQSFTINNRQLTRADLSEIQKGRREWENKKNQEVAAASGGHNRYALADFTK